jgi:hypothetical protein
VLGIDVDDLRRMRDALFFEGPETNHRLMRFWALLFLAAVIATAGIVAGSTASSTTPMPPTSATSSTRPCETRSPASTRRAAAIRSSERWRHPSPKSAAPSLAAASLCIVGVTWL